MASGFIGGGTKVPRLHRLWRRRAGWRIVIAKYSIGSTLPGQRGFWGERL